MTYAELKEPAEHYRYDWDLYKKGAHGYVYILVNNEWLRSSADWGVITKKGERVR